eukprot:scaffold37234_cov633-Skeletonema_dohrnii-CCMP3373.AAC.1
MPCYLNLNRSVSASTTTIIPTSMPIPTLSPATKAESYPAMKAGWPREEFVCHDKCIANKMQCGKSERRSSGAS